MEQKFNTVSAVEGGCHEKNNSVIWHCYADDYS